MREHWQAFKVAYQRSYDSVVEEEQRYDAFVLNLKLADERNERERRHNGTAVHGVTKYSDLTPAEFATRYLTTKPPGGGHGNESLKLSGATVVSRTLTEAAAGSSQDWTDIYTTKVKDQGYCGSCWAFSVTEQLESDAIRQLKTWYTLSPQQITSCDREDDGCDGGWPTTAYAWVNGVGGLVGEDEYPYTSGGTGDSGACDEEKMEHKHVTVTTWYALESEESMAAYMLDTEVGGPIAAVVDASDWQTYSHGTKTTCGMDVNHAVQITGVSSDVWKVRNSWGEDWGEKGYIFLKYGEDLCSITYLPTYTDTELVEP